MYLSFFNLFQLQYDETFENADMPQLAVCYSGGGVRAAIGSLGFTLGLINIGLYDSILYSSGLSGGSWFQTLWTVNGDTNQSPDDFKALFRKSLTEDPFLIGKNRTEMLVNAIFRNSSYSPGNDIAISDLYGIMLAMQWLHPHLDRTSKLLRSTVSDQANISNRPIPIYNAVHPNSFLRGDYEWVEFTPFEARFLNSNLTTPMWAFGRQFFNGKSVSVSPEICIGPLLGMWGSAFAASLSETIRVVGYRAPALASILSLLPGNHRSVSPPLYYNPGYHLNGSNLKTNLEVELVDAGVCMNAPLPPLLMPCRGNDIILVFDARPTDFDINDSKDVLRRLEVYCNVHNIPIPTFSYENIGSKSISCFIDDDDSIPVIIYFPLIKSEKVPNFDPLFEADVASFTYSESMFDKLCNLMQFNTEENIETLKIIILQVAERKKRKRLQKQAFNQEHVLIL